MRVRGETKVAEEEREQAINAIFYMLKLAFPLKYNLAFSTCEKENQAKKYWFETLKHYPASFLIEVAKTAIGAANYFVDLADILRCCRKMSDLLGIPDARQAYIEACGAPPRADHCWSHPAVYLAAKATGWTFLKSEQQYAVFPIFERHYERICRQMLTQNEVVPKMQVLQQKGQELFALQDKKALQIQKERMRSMAIDPSGGRREFLKIKMGFQKEKI